MDTPTTPVFLESRSKCRTKAAVGGVLISTAVCTCLLFPLITTVLNRPWKDLPTGTVFALLCPSWFLALTLLVGWHVLRNTEVYTRLDGAGIWIDDKQFAWDQIDRLWGREVGLTRQRVNLWAQERSVDGLPQEGIPLAPVLLLHEYIELRDRLGAYLRERHPHVRLE